LAEFEAGLLEFRQERSERVQALPERGGAPVAHHRTSVPTISDKRPSVCFCNAMVSARIFIIDGSGTLLLRGLLPPQEIFTRLSLPYCD
jgi:hypothetical protein